MVEDPTGAVVVGVGPTDDANQRQILAVRSSDGVEQPAPLITVAGKQGWMAALVVWLHDTTSLQAGLAASSEPILVSITDFKRFRDNWKKVRERLRVF